MGVYWQVRPRRELGFSGRQAMIRPLGGRSQDRKAHQRGTRELATDQRSISARNCARSGTGKRRHYFTNSGMPCPRPTPSTTLWRVLAPGSPLLLRITERRRPGPPPRPPFWSDLPPSWRQSLLRRFSLVPVLNSVAVAMVVSSVPLDIQASR